MANQIIAVMMMMFLLIGSIFLFWNLPDYFSATQTNILALFLVFGMGGIFLIVVAKEFVS